MKHYALLGERLGHSLSVPIHQAIFERMGIDADYRLIEIPRPDFASTAKRLIRELDGFNVTIPYKEEIIPLLTNLDEGARAIGAVNTVVTGDAPLGYNTDILGFTAMLRHFSIDPKGQPCYVLGTGGTAKTARAALRLMGAARVTVVSRHPTGEEIGYSRLAEEFSGLLVNTTPAGMWPDVTGCPIASEVLPSVMRRAAGVVDVIYNPPETVLTAAAKTVDIPACTGLYMLIDQAVAAERLWQSTPLPDDLTQTLMKELKLQ